MYFYRNRALIEPSLDALFALNLFLAFNKFSFTRQFRYKSRVYRQPNVDEKQIAKLHTKVRSFSKSLLCNTKLRCKAC